MFFSSFFEVSQVNIFVIDTVALLTATIHLNHLIKWEKNLFKTEKSHIFQVTWKVHSFWSSEQSIFLTLCNSCQSIIIYCLLCFCHIFFNNEVLWKYKDRGYFYIYLSHLFIILRCKTDHCTVNFRAILISFLFLDENI